MIFTARPAWRRGWRSASGSRPRTSCGKNGRNSASSRSVFVCARGFRMTGCNAVMCKVILSECTSVATHANVRSHSFFPGKAEGGCAGQLPRRLHLPDGCLRYRVPCSTTSIRCLSSWSMKSPYMELPMSGAKCMSPISISVCSAGQAVLKHGLPGPGPHQHLHDQRRGHPRRLQGLGLVRLGARRGAPRRCGGGAYGGHDLGNSLILVGSRPTRISNYSHPRQDW